MELTELMDKEAVKSLLKTFSNKHVIALLKANGQKIDYEVLFHTIAPLVINLLEPPFIAGSSVAFKPGPHLFGNLAK